MIQRYVDHAICLKNTILALRYNQKILSHPDCDGGVDLIRCERINSLDEATRLRVPRSFSCFSPSGWLVWLIISLHQRSVDREELRRLDLYGAHLYGDRRNDTSDVSSFRPTPARGPFFPFFPSFHSFSGPSSADLILCVSSSTQFGGKSLFMKRWVPVLPPSCIPVELVSRTCHRSFWSSCYSRSAEASHLTHKGGSLLVSSRMSDYH